MCLAICLVDFDSRHVTQVADCHHNPCGRITQFFCKDHCFYTKLPFFSLELESSQKKEAFLLRGSVLHLCAPSQCATSVLHLAAGSHWLIAKRFQFPDALPVVAELLEDGFVVEGVA